MAVGVTRLPGPGHGDHGPCCISTTRVSKVLVQAGKPPAGWRRIKARGLIRGARRPEGPNFLAPHILLVSGAWTNPGTRFLEREGAAGAQEAWRGVLQELGQAGIRGLLGVMGGSFHEPLGFLEIANRCPQTWGYLSRP